MEKQYIITIVREFGSMGRPIARRLSELLGIEFYDRDIVEETARKMNLPVSVISINEENQGSAYSRMRFPLGKSSREKQDEICQYCQRKQRKLHLRGNRKHPYSD